MSERIHALAQHLFGKATIEECDLSEVKGLAQRYPYFAPAQFLLLEKLKQEGSEEYNAQLQKAILYYPDPLEFQYFIHSDRYYTEINFDDQELGEREADDTLLIDEPIAAAVVEKEQENQGLDTAIDDTEVVRGLKESEVPMEEPGPASEQEVAIEPAIFEPEVSSAILEPYKENEINNVNINAGGETAVNTV